MQRINQPDIKSKLIARFKLMPLDLGMSLMLGDTVQLISSVDFLLQKPKAAYGALNLNVATNIFVPLLTVPAQKRYRLTYVAKSQNTTGTSVMQVRIGGVAVSMFTGTGMSYQAVDIWLAAGDQFGSLGTNDGADTSVVHSCAYEEEDTT